ncbi:hypothetical protein [Streptomyces sp. NPDC096311]|uniref:hypothetical protein n=1 Tax=Streptomyces sp. NPDC096311 TaxID=3366083 RepID=UPI0038081D6B
MRTGEAWPIAARRTQAVLALARRRVNVLWALLRDQRNYAPAPRPHTRPDA